MLGCSRKFIRPCRAIRTKFGKLGAQDFAGFLDDHRAALTARHAAEDEEVFKFLEIRGSMASPTSFTCKVSSAKLDFDAGYPEPLLSLRLPVQISVPL
ncbi:MAG: hypothetical protein ACR2OZ_15305 [Verrucomicrobiales bacterium]